VSLLFGAIAALGGSFRPGQVWLDTSGQPLQAHGGGIIYDRGTYYWHGNILPTAAQLRAGFNFLGFRCNSSLDLYNWKNEGLALSAVTNDPTHDLHFSKVCEGAKVLYNAKSSKYVMWFHVDAKPGYNLALAGVAVASRPTGPFQYQRSFHPDGESSRDLTLFKDDDGTAYLIFDAGAHTHIHIARLTDDYLATTGDFANAFWHSGPPEGRESPLVFKCRGKYFIITSGTTGWAPSAAEYAVADSMFGPWTVRGNPCVGTNAEVTFFSQGAHALPLASPPGAFIFMADRWKVSDRADWRYVWLPIRFTQTGIEIRWLDSWDLSWFNDSREN
jgi:hypothetical protein